MSYLRGQNYIWSDDRVHFWIGDGYEDVSEIEWSVDKDKPGGVSISQDVIDEFVIMRFTELLETEKVRLLEKIEAVASTNTNFGAEALRVHKDSLEKFVRKFNADV